MAKRTRRRSATRQDATVRNVRAAKRRYAATKGKISTLAERVEELERQVDRITKSLRALAVV